MDLERLTSLALLGMTVALSGSAEATPLESDEGSTYYVRGCECGKDINQKKIRLHHQGSDKKSNPSIG